MPRVHSPTAIGLAVAGRVLLVYALLTGGAVIAFAGEAFLLTVAMLAPGRGDDADPDDPPDDDPGPHAPSGAGLGHHRADGHQHSGEDRDARHEHLAGRVVVAPGLDAG